MLDVLGGPPVAQNFSMTAGDTQMIQVTITTTDGSVVDLTGMTVTWGLARSPRMTALVTKGLGTGITVPNAPNGIAEIMLDPADTIDLVGRYYHELEIIDRFGEVSTVMTGHISIKPTLVAAGTDPGPTPPLTAGVIVSDTPPVPAQGKLWFDSAGVQLYIGFNDGDSLQWVAPTMQTAVTAASGGAVTVSDAPPVPVAGKLWFDSVGTQLYIGYDDGTSIQWIPSNNQPSEAPLYGITKNDRSGAITLANQAQVVMAANPKRRGWSLQNKSSANMWFNDLGGSADPAANSSTYLPPGAYYESETNGASITSVSIIGDVTAAQYVAKEW
jgi:hypothetical protein